jgi:fimbrial chaperone protein
MLCRFALMIDDDNDAATDVKLGNIQLPVAGRIGVVVYVAVGDVKANLEILSIASQTYQSRFIPVATVRNTGTLHGRLEGTLEGKDTTGQSIDFSVATLPILPGETRLVPIWPNEDSKGKPPIVNYPLTLSGVIEWAGGKYNVQTKLAAPIVPITPIAAAAKSP